MQNFFYDPQGGGAQHPHHNNQSQHLNNGQHHHQPFNPYDNNQILTFPHPPNQPWSANQSEMNGNYSNHGSSSNSGGGGNNDFSAANTTNTSSIFDGVKNFFSGLLTQNEFTPVKQHDDDFDSDEESDEDPEQQVKQLYGVNIKKNEELSSNHAVTTLKKKQSTSSTQLQDDEEEDEVPMAISKIISTNGRGQTLTLNKDFDVAKCSKLAVKLRYEKTAVEKEMENERAWSLLKHKTAQEEDAVEKRRIKTKPKFHDNDDYGFYDELAREDSITREVKESAKSNITKEETIEVDVPFTMYAVAYSSFGAPICYFTSDQTNGPRTYHSIASIPKYEKTLKKKGLKSEEISTFESIYFLDTRAMEDTYQKQEGDNGSNDGSEDEQSTTSSKKATVQEEIAILNLKKGKQDKYQTLTEERFHYVIFFVEFISPEFFLKQQIQKRKGETKIIKRVPFSNKMTLSILDLTFGENNAKELCRFNTIVNNKKNSFGRQIVGGIHYKPKLGWKFRSSNEFQPLPPKKLIVKLESVEDIPFLSDVYISLWFNDDKCKTKVIKSKNPKFNEIFEYDISGPDMNPDVCHAVMFDQIRILLKEKKAFQKEEKRLIGEVVLPPLPQIFSGNNYVFAYTLPPLANNTSEKDRSERKKGPILYFSSEYGLQNQGVIGTSRAKIAIFLSW